VQSVRSKIAIIDLGTCSESQLPPLASTMWSPTMLPKLPGSGVGSLPYLLSTNQEHREGSFQKEPHPRDQRTYFVNSAGPRRCSGTNLKQLS
jgi:hypothetical protein